MAILRMRGRMLAMALAVGLCAGAPPRAGADQPITVYKDANCGCCAKWIEHIHAHGIAARAIDLDAGALAERKRELGIAPRMQSCHTGVTADGRIFEGHVPATSMTRFLAAHPSGARGLAVPGMPPGSPGMEMGDRFVPYSVWQLNAGGGVAAFEEIENRGAQYAPGQQP